MSTTFILILTFSAGFLVVFAVNLMMADLFVVRREQIRKRLEEDLRIGQRERARDSLQQKDLYELAAQGSLDLSDRMTLQEKLELFVDQSGANVRPARILVLTLLAAVTCFVAVGWRFGWSLGSLAAPIGGAIPFAYLHLLRMKRVRRLQAQLPDVFDLMSRVLRAGRTIPQAFQSVADEFPRPASEEFGYAYEQQNLGLSPEAAMRELAHRTGLLELKIFVMAVMIHQQSGGNLADLLEKLAGIIRDRFRIKGMIRSLTAEGRLQAAILLGLPPFLLAVITVINRPYAMTLYEYPTLLTGMFGFMLLGAAWMHRIVNFDF